MVPVVGRPFLEYQIDLIKQAGVDEIVLCTIYLAETINEYFGSGQSHGIRLHYNLEETPLGTGGAVKDAERFFAGDEVIVFNGDILTDHDLSALIDFHHSKGAAATLTLHPVPRPNPYGVIETDSEKRITAFKEPSIAAKKAASGLTAGAAGGFDDINAGMYVLDSRVFEDVPQGEPWSFERQLFPSLIERGAPIYGIRSTGYWLDIGHPYQYLEANRAVLSGDVRTSAFPKAGGDLLAVNAGAHTAGARLSGPVHIESDVTLASGAAIGPNVTIGRGSKIGSEARVRNSVLLDECSVGEEAQVEGAILDSGCIVGPGAQVRSGTVLGMSSRVG
jgi:NDP-sugar pyrophosphorylase family protein